jgi:hypothetical protein
MEILDCPVRILNWRTCFVSLAGFSVTAVLHLTLTLTTFCLAAPITYLAVVPLSCGRSAALSLTVGELDLFAVMDELIFCITGVFVGMGGGMGRCMPSELNLSSNMVS